MGVPQATLLPATARENRACAAAGAIRDSNPRIAATKQHPQIALSGMYPAFTEITLKNLENGKAPSLEKAQV